MVFKCIQELYSDSTKQNGIQHSTILVFIRTEAISMYEKFTMRDNKNTDIHRSASKENGNGIKRERKSGAIWECMRFEWAQVKIIHKFTWFISMADFFARQIHFSCNKNECSTCLWTVRRKHKKFRIEKNESIKAYNTGIMLRNTFYQTLSAQ